MLTEQQVQQYKRDGYLLVPNYATSEEVQTLKSRVQEVIKEIVVPEQLAVFTTKEQERVSNAYFLTSGDKVRCFFEESAIDKSGNLLEEKRKAINKIGHALHDLDPVFETFTYQEKLSDLAKVVGLKKPTIIQSQYIFKSPHIGGFVNPHTDSTFLYTEPTSCTGVWIALEDATVENGCLWAIPMSHKTYALQQRFVRNETNDGTIFINTDAPKVDWDLSKMQPLEAKAGDMILLHGLCVHMSYANKSEQSRHAYVLHLVDLQGEWLADNWLQKSSFRVIE